MVRDEISTVRVRVVTALILLATFLTGGAVGVGLYQWRLPPRHGPPPFMGRAFEELGLSAAQQIRVREISDRHRTTLESILRESYPRVRAINEQMERELRAVLTPEQQKKFDEIRARRPPPPPRHDGFPGHRGPPGMGPGMHPPGMHPPGMPPGPPPW